MTFHWDPSPSPDVAAYILAVALIRIVGHMNNELGLQPVYEVGAWVDYGRTAGLVMADPMSDPPVGGCYWYSVDAEDWAGNRSPSGEE